MLPGLFQDVKYSLRSFARQPLFTLTAVCSLALGIGACVVIYSVVYAVLLKPLPYREPGQLVHLKLVNPKQGDNEYSSVAPAMLAALRAQPDTGLTVLAGQAYDYANLTNVPTPEQLTVGLVTEGYLSLFGVRPALGRLLDPMDFKPGAPLVTVLSHKLWRTQFHADTHLLGQTILVGDKPRVVVGVMPAGFKEPNNVSELWLPVAQDDPMMASWSNRSLTALARLADGRPAGQVRTRAALDVASANFAAAHPEDYKGWHLEAQPIKGVLFEDKTQTRALWLLFGAVACVLLVTCANVANLQLVRASARRRELGVRLALGASRGRVMRQCLLESGLLALAGGGLALLLAAWGVDAVRALLPPGFSTRQDEIALNWPVFGFAVLVAAAAGLLSGVLPAWFASRQDPAGTLAAAGAGRGAAGGLGGSRTRNGLVVAEISLALVLLAGAALLGRSFLALLQANPGLRTERVLSVNLSLSEQRYPDAARRTEFYRRVLEAVRAVPGVDNAALTSTQFFNWNMAFNFLKPGQAADDPAVARQAADYDSINPECFAALDIPVREGRAFSDHDKAGSPLVAVVNEQFVRRFYPEGNPLGGKLTLTGTRQPLTVEIVGVAADVKRQGIEQTPHPQIYVSYLQRPTTFGTLWVRAGGGMSAEALTHSVQTVILGVDPDMPVADVSTLDKARRASVGSVRLYLALFALFAALTLGLAALGVYGTVSFSVGQRTREIGIRMALGAQITDVMRLVLGQGVRLIVAGLALGLAAALGLSRVVASVLYGVNPRDPATLGAVALGLGAVALLASYLPARRAARIDPLTALREE